MSKFCTKCGRPLQEGEICSCQMTAGDMGVNQPVQPIQLQKPAQPVQTQQPVQPQVQSEQSQQPVQPQVQSEQSQQPVQPQVQSEQSQQPVQPQQLNQPAQSQQPVQPGPQYSGQPGQPFGGQPGPQYSGQPGPQYSGQPGQPFNGQPGPQYNGQPGQQFNGQPFGGQPGQPFNGQPDQQFHAQEFGRQASVFAQSFLGRVIGLVKKPVTAGKALILEADIKVALLLIAFQGIFSALFALAVAGKVGGLIRAASGMANGISAGLGSSVAEIMKMPYFRIFVVTIIFSVVLACALAGLLMLGHMIIKIPVSYQQMLSATAIRSAVLVPAILLSIIVFELFPGIGLALFVLVNIWGFSAMIVAMSSFIEQEKLNIFVLVVSVIILLFVVIAVFVFSKIWTLYLPDMVRTALNGLGHLSGAEILEEILGM